MANSNATISIGFKIEDGPDGFKQMTVSAKSLKQVLHSTVQEAEALRKPLINFAALATGIDSVSSTISSLQSTLKNLSDAYAAQIEVEQQLAVNMRNTMDAREEDIQSIKDLCSAQQAIGIIGDEVQLAGAQELATYLSLKSSLEQLIPVMNDMLAQQYGLAASQENATQIATMLGKVMDGQVGALRRYGYTFDESQEQILKFGEESERAAILVDVISSSVGGMNEALAKTDVGRLKQLENTIGDIKEQFGEYATMIAPFTTVAANFAILAAGALKVAAGMKVASTYLTTLNTRLHTTEISSKRLAIGLSGLGRTGKVLAGGVKVLGFTFQGTTASVKAFSLALRSIIASTGVGLVIWGISEAITYLSGKSDEATDSVQDLDEATEAYKEAATSAQVQIDKDIQSLKELVDAHKEDASAIDRVNDTYGRYIGLQSTVKGCYDALVQYSRTYVKQIGLEAQARALASQIAANSIDKELKLQEKAQWEAAHKDKRVSLGRDKVTGQTRFAYNDDEWKKLRDEVEQLDVAAAGLQNRLEAINNQKLDNFEEMGGSASNVNKELAVTAMNLQQVESAISDTEKALKGTVDDSEITRLRAYNVELKKRKQYLEAKTGLATSTPKTPKTEKKVLPLDPKKVEEINALIAKQTTVVGNYIGKVTKAEAAFADLGVQWHEQPRNIKEINDNLSILQAQLDNASFEDAANINRQIESLNTLADGYRNAGMAAVDASAYVSEVGSVMQSLSSVLGDAGAGWLSWSANVCQAVSQALPALRTLVNALQAKAAGEAASQSASMGPFGWIAGIAAMGSILAAFATLPKFANGGVISGPTVGLMGEYPGAANNPEVVAPLDKLQDLITPANNLGGTVIFRIEGRTLVGILNKENSFSSRRR